MIQRYEIRLKHNSPLLHHRMTEEALMSLLAEKGTKKKVKNYVTPRGIAQEHAYQYKNGDCYIPTSYITRSLMHVASDYKQKNSQRKSYKAIIGGIFMPEKEDSLLIDENDKPIKNWEVDIRKGTNHQAGAVAICRPRFDEWETKFTCKIHTDLVTPDMILLMLNDAGVRAGIGSFRVCKGGWFGKFQVTKFEPIKD